MQDQAKASLVFMVEPDSFYMNEDTADNAYQRRGERKTEAMMEAESRAAIQEHRILREKISAAGVSVATISGPKGKPDAIFPNNSFSIHEKDGKIIVILYPMSAGRRDELPETFIAFLKSIAGDEFYDLRHYQAQGKYLEGTGVLNFDAGEQAVFMCRSQRASEEVLPEISRILKIGPERIFVFDSFDQESRPIYHTNVMSWVGEGIIAICLESIPEGPEKARLVSYLEKSNYTMIDLGYGEINAFAGNALEVTAMQGRRLLTISESGWRGLTPAHRSIIESHYGADGIIPSSIDTIECLGGGSVRCTQAKGDLKCAQVEEILKNSMRF